MPSSPSNGVVAAAPTHPHRLRAPERGLLYRLAQAHVATWIVLREKCDGPPAHVEREPRRYLECGILARGFTRAHCDARAHEFLIVFSCKGRGVCPSCSAKHMRLTAAHLVSSVIAPVPVRQWVHCSMPSPTYMSSCSTACANMMSHGACAFRAPWGWGAKPWARSGSVSGTSALATPRHAAFS